ncbi:MAG TPA: ABC transporter ATP-binding protein [Cytophagaceae bacterium]|jgi:subfamily B ATP-binding cassette protein MsbA
MKVYFRLLSFAKPIEKFAIPYFIYSILSVVFGLLNFTLLIPLFDILFKEESITAVNDIILTKPHFELNSQYFKDLFYYEFHRMVRDYGKMGALQFVCIVILASVFLSNLFRYLSQRIMESFRIHILLNMRKIVFDKVMGLHMGFFSNERKGDIMSRITGDVSGVMISISNTLLVFFKEPVTLIGYFVVLFMMSARLTVFTIFFIPASGLIISMIVKKLKAAAVESNVSQGVLFSILDEALSGLRVIKAFNAVEYIQTKFHNENLNYARIARSMVKRQELASPISEFMGVSVVAGILLYGGSLVLAKDPSLSASTFVAYIIIFSQVLRPAKAISSSFGSITSGVAAGERVLSLIDAPNDIVDKDNAIVINDFKNELEFENVSFSYGLKQVLSGISFKIPKGKTVALVGPSGGGKSTISDLIPRFYDPTSGEILIDGHNLKDCAIESIRAQMGIVSQESILFNDTILNNIAFGMPHASKDDVIQAAKVANAHNFIIGTENGYETFIGDRGVKLSGGQKQRLSIARAVLKNPPILILDEATSALDTESEKLVQQALSNLMQNRTSLVIAHRLSTIQNADEIIVVENGKIVERGSHADLIRQNGGLYFKLNMMQTI